MGSVHPLRVSRRWPIVAGVILASTVGAPIAALADWPQFQGDPAHVGVSDGPTAPLRIAWTNDDVEVEDADVALGLSQPVVARDGTIVTVAPRAVLAFEAEDGAQRFSVERDLGPSTQPAIGQGADGPVVVYTEGFGDSGPTATTSPTASPSPDADQVEEGFDSHVNAIDLETGEPVWEEAVPLEEVVQAPVAADDSAAYVGDIAGVVTAIELATGDVRWAVDVGTPVIGAVATDGDRAFVATFGPQRGRGEVVALDVSSGEEIWRSDEESTVGNLVSAPVLDDGRLFLLEPGIVVCLDADDGGALWRTEVVTGAVPFGRQIAGSQSPVIAADRVVAVDVTGRVFAFDAESGARVWDHALNDPSTVSPFLVTADHVLVPGDAGVLSAIDLRTGHLRFRLDVGGALLRGLADAGDVLVAVDGLDDARLVALEADPGGTLIDEPSPTTVDVGRMLVGFLLGGILVAVLVVLLARPLQRRLLPAPDAGGPTEGQESPG